MSIGRVDSSTDLRNRLLAAGGAGAVAGTAYSVTKKNWLYKDNPSDVFIKKVSENLEESITSNQRKEAIIINDFLKSAVDPTVGVHTLKPKIKASEELSAAIKDSPMEDVDVAIERVFSEPDTDKLRKNLIALQAKTKSDKLYGTNTALQLVHQNYDKDTKTLKKCEKTPQEVFGMIKSTAKKIQVKSAVAAAATGAAIVAGLALVFTDTDKVGKK